MTHQHQCATNYFAHAKCDCSFASTQSPTPATASEPRAPVLTDEQVTAFAGRQLFSLHGARKMIREVEAAVLAAAPTATDPQRPAP